MLEEHSDVITRRGEVQYPDSVVWKAGAKPADIPTNEVTPYQAPIRLVVLVHDLVYELQVPLVPHILEEAPYHRFGFCHYWYLSAKYQLIHGNYPVWAQPLIGYEIIRWW
jgi:hypothetical protein